MDSVLGDSQRAFSGNFKVLSGSDIGAVHPACDDLGGDATPCVVLAALITDAAGENDRVAILTGGEGAVVATVTAAANICAASGLVLGVTMPPLMMVPNLADMLSLPMPAVPVESLTIAPAAVCLPIFSSTDRA